MLQSGLHFRPALGIGCLLLLCLTLALAYWFADLLDLFSIQEPLHTQAAWLVPAFPGATQDDGPNYNPYRGSGMALRVLNVDHANIKSVAAFYHQALSKPPWQIYAEHWNNETPGVSDYCTIFARPVFGGLWVQTFSVELLGGDQLGTKSASESVTIEILTGVEPDSPCIVTANSSPVQTN